MVCGVCGVCGVCVVCVVCGVWCVDVCVVWCLVFGVCIESNNHPNQGSKSIVRQKRKPLRVKVFES